MLKNRENASNLQEICKRHPSLITLGCQAMKSVNTGAFSECLSAAGVETWSALQPDIPLESRTPPQTPPCSLPPHPRTDEQLRLWPLPHPQFSPSAAACSPLPCFLHIHHWHVCHLLPFCSFAPSFCSAFALCWCGSFSSQLPSCYLLTLRRKVSKLWSRDGKSLLSSPTF